MVTSQTSPSCPDGGVCHHDCGEGPCFRGRTCGPLSEAHLGNRWPQDVVDTHSAREGGEAHTKKRHGRHGAGAACASAASTALPASSIAAQVIRDFIVTAVSIEAGPALTQQADELVVALQNAGVLTDTVLIRETRERLTCGGQPQGGPMIACGRRIASGACEHPLATQVRLTSAWVTVPTTD